MYFSSISVSYFLLLNRSDSHARSLFKLQPLIHHTVDSYVLFSITELIRGSEDCHPSKDQVGKDENYNWFEMLPLLVTVKIVANEGAFNTPAVVQTIPPTV